MKALFKNARFKLLKEGSFKNYLLYAIGEVLLLTLGVLIALQINNWNANRKLRNQEVFTVKNLIEEIEFNNNVLKTVNETDSVAYINNKKLLIALKSQKPKNDTLLNKYFTNMLTKRKFIPRKSVYQNLKSNNFDVIKSDTIRTKLSFIYDALYNYLEDHQNNLKDKSYDKLYDFAERNFEFTLDYKMEPNDLDNILKNVGFKNTLSFYIIQTEYLNKQNLNTYYYLEQQLLDIKNYLEEIQ